MATGSPRPAGGERRSTRARTLDTLRRRIISLELPPGAGLSENELSAQLGVSRTPVRESLILLAEEGLVQVFPQVGTFVSLVDPERVAQAQFVREAIECASLSSVELPLAAPDEDALRDNLRQQTRAAAAGDTEQFFALDEEFHRALLRIGRHESAWGTVTSAKAHLDRARRLSLVDTRPLDTLVAQHTSVADSLGAGRLDAAVEALRGHLRAVFDDVAAIRAARPHLFTGSGEVRPSQRRVATLS